MFTLPITTLETSLSGIGKGGATALKLSDQALCGGMDPDSGPLLYSHIHPGANAEVVIETAFWRLPLLSPLD